MASPSLRKYPAAAVEEMKQKFGELHPPVLPECHWQPDGPLVKLYNSETGQPLQWTGPVDTVMGFFKQDSGAMSFSMEFGANADGKPTCATGKWLNGIFGPGGSMAEAINEHSKTLFGAKGPKIPGKGENKLLNYVNEDLARQAGKPNLAPQPLKPRTDDDGNNLLKLGITAYAKKAAAGVERELGTVPPELKEAFAGCPDHPFMQFFETNPEEHPQAPTGSVAAAGTDASSFWSIIAALSNQGQKQWYWKGLAQMTIGGIALRYNRDRGIITCSMYLNGPGLRVYAGIDTSRGDDVATDPRDTDVYASVGAVKRPNPDDDVYGAIEDKRARVDEE